MSEAKNARKGIILAGGTGSRLYPVTLVVSKQLLPIYDKPMIYYPLSVLMLAGIREILIITTPKDCTLFEQLLGDGSQWGINLKYETQESPDGLAQAYIIAEEFLSGDPSALILGDNIFFGHGLPNLLQRISREHSGATILGYHVSNPSQYGVIEFTSDGSIRSIIEKPSSPPSNYAITGLYFLDSSAPERAKKVTRSARGELEITSLLDMYLQDELLHVEKMGRGYAWLDTGTFSSMLDASNFVRTLTERQGLKVGLPDEVALHLGWINSFSGNN